MPRLIPGQARYAYGGMIEGRDYLAVVKVLDDVALIAGIKDDADVHVADLPAKVQEALDRANEISFDLGFDEGFAKGEVGTQIDAAAVRQEGYNEGYDIGYREGGHVAASQIDEIAHPTRRRRAKE